MSELDKKKGNSFVNFIKRYFFTGLLISAPIGATIYITIFIVEFIAGLVPQRFNPNGLLPEIIGYEIPGLELIIAFLSFILIGLIFSTLFGKAILGYFDNLITRIPFAGNVYKAIKQITETFSNADADNASCSECGSSIINRSAPRPVIAPPTPAAKYSPPCAVSHLPAA